MGAPNGLIVCCSKIFAVLFSLTESKDSFKLFIIHSLFCCYDCVRSFTINITHVRCCSLVIMFNIVVLSALSMSVLLELVTWKCSLHLLPGMCILSDICCINKYVNAFPPLKYIYFSLWHGTSQLYNNWWLFWTVKYSLKYL